MSDETARVEALAEAIFAPTQAFADRERAEYQRSCVEWCEQHAGELFALREQNATLMVENARLRAQATHE